jgi:hypothetical protein
MTNRLSDPRRVSSAAQTTTGARDVGEMPQVRWREISLAVRMNDISVQTLITRNLPTRAATTAHCACPDYKIAMT